MDAKIIDITEVLAGRTMPKDRIPVFVDEQVMVEFAKVCFKADRGDEDAARYRDEIVSQMAEMVLWVEIQKPPRHVLRAINAQMLKDFPPKYSPLGLPLPDPEAAEEHEVRTWAAHLTAIESASGVIPTSTETVRVIRDQFPQASIDAIANAINAMVEGAKSGYDQAVQELGFLSQPSPEA